MKIYTNASFRDKLRYIKDRATQTSIRQFLRFVDRSASPDEIERETRKADNDISYKRTNTCFLLFTIKREGVVFIDVVDRV